MKEVPNVIYKYRDWNNPYHKRVLTHREIYFASANEFNDPFDCSMPFRYKESDLTEDNIFLKLIEMGRKLHPDWTDSQLHELAFKTQQERKLLDENHYVKHDQATNDSFNNTFGILCLSENRSNILMWSHYAQSHNGFSIGYFSRKLFKNAGGEFGPVQYEGEFPKFDIFGSHVEYFIKRAFVKSKIWEYESEYRLIRPKDAGKTAVLDSDCVSEIILGCKMHQSAKFEILKLAEDRYPKAKVFDCNMNQTKFELSFSQVR